MSYIAGKQDKIVTRGLLYAVDGIDHGTFPGNGSSSTTYLDLVGATSSATLQNDTTYRYHKNGILSLDKDNTDYYSVALNLSGTSIASVGMWARFREYPTSSTGMLMEFSDNMNDVQGGWQVYAGSSSNSYDLGVAVKGNAGVNQSNFNKTLVNDGHWHYIVFIFDKSQGTNECSLFVDGTQATATSNTATSNNTNTFGNETLYIGGRAPTSGTTALLPWTMDLGPLHVYNVRLSAAEVTQNYNLWKSRFVPRPDISHISSGSVGAYDLNSYGGSGAVTDSVGSANATLNSAPTYHSTESGSYLQLDGTDDYLDTGAIAVSLNSDFTFEAIFENTAGDSQTSSGKIMFQGDVTNTGHWAALSFGDASVGERQKIKFSVDDNSTKSETGVTGNISAGEFHHIVGMRDRGADKLRLYLDGELISETTDNSNTVNPDSDEYLIFGARRYDGTVNSEFPNMKLGFAKTYSRALSAAEVKQNYNTLMPKYVHGLDVGTTDYSKNIEQSGLAVNFDFGSPITYPGSGTSVIDVKGGYTGTLSGATYSKNNGGYVDFDGSNDYISTTWTQPAQDSSSTFSWMVWVYADSQANPPVIGDRGGDLNFTKLTTNNFEYYHSSSPLTFGGTVTTGAWKNICIVKNGTNFVYYTDGAETATGSNSQSKSTRSFFIGGDNGAGEYFDGRIAQVCVYTTALTAAQVLSNYTATKSRFGL